MRVTESAIASLGYGDELRVPLAVFFCTSVRGEIERQLEGRDLHPQWDAARKAVDLAGTPIRLVPVVRVADAS
jgi:hypothetical protein